MSHTSVIGDVANKVCKDKDAMVIKATKLNAKTKMWACVCNGDLCNSADGIALSALVIVTTVLVGLFNAFQ